MKKNTMMRIAAALLVLVMITTCAISGTFAKYVTSGNSSDNARVAKWGVTVTANGNTFDGAYYNTAVAKDSETATVVTSGEYDVVAPGTNGSMATMSLSGTPEVDVSVTYSAEVTLTNWVLSDETNATEYCPLVFKVNNGDEIKIDTTNTTVEKLESALEAAINGYSKTYQANTNLAEQGDDSLAVTWAWAYEGENANDTTLGDRAANNKAATVSIAITTTVTQVD